MFRLPCSVPNSPLLRPRGEKIIKPRELSGQFIYPVTIKMTENDPNRIEIVKLAQTAKEQNYRWLKYMNENIQKENIRFLLKKITLW